MASTRETTFETARKCFPGAENAPYLNVAARGLLSERSRMALERNLDELQEGSADKAAYFEKVEHVRAKFARLINADADEIAFTKNVSDGLNIIAGAIQWNAGDNVVICAALEHPNNVYPWLNLARRFGVEVRRVPDRDASVDIEAMIAAMDRRTRLVTLSPVTFAPGLRADVRPLGRACRTNGTFLLLDGAQSVGVVDTNVREQLVDGLAVSTQKGLLGLYGLGFLYCRREWAEAMTPSALARFSVNLGGGAAHEASISSGDYALMPAARRFDLGNYNYPAVFAVDPSLDLLLEIGTAAIDRHVTGLAQKLSEGLLCNGLPVSGGADPTVMSHIVTAGQYSEGENDRTSDPLAAALYEHLIESGVRLTLRRGMLRFSTHLYNNESDIDQVLDMIRDWRRRMGK